MMLTGCLAGVITFTQHGGIGPMQGQGTHLLPLYGEKRSGAPGADAY